MKRGGKWEGRLALWHHDYLVEGRGRIKQLYPEVRKAEGGKLFWADVGPPDFMGTFRRKDGSWSPIVFDAKETRDPSLYVSRVPLHQAQDLEGFWLAGWVSGLMLSNNYGAFFLSWEHARKDYWDPAKPKKFDLSPSISLNRNGWIDLL